MINKLSEKSQKITNQREKVRVWRREREREREEMKK
jgi:hypothetical protein